MNRLLAVPLFLLAMTGAHAASTDYVFRNISYGCQNRDTSARLDDMAAAGEMKAMQAELNTLLTKGECKGFLKGVPVYLKDTNISRRFAKVGLHGEPEAYWVPKKTLLTLE